MDLLKTLSRGDRKEIAESKKVARSLLNDMDLLTSLFKVLTENAENSPVVSHGFFALKEASLKNENIRKKTLRFCKTKIGKFVQWEARENFLRVCLISIEEDKALYRKVLPMVEGSSAIVQSYASEYLIRYHNEFEAASLKKMLEKLDSLAHRASVKARIRKIKKELKL